MSPPPGPIPSLETIRALLATRVIGATLHVHDEVDSTNRLAVDLAQAGTPDGTVVVAESQTAGRGRQGRQWFSPSGGNLYLSVILTGTNSPGIMTWIPLLASVAVVRAIQEVTGLSTRVKWPNDVLAYRDGHGRKVAGILAEATGGDPNDIRAIVVGIGINANMPLESFPEDLSPIATSLLIETEHPVDRIRLLATLLLEFEHLYAHLRTHGTAGIRESYLPLSDTLGKQVRIELVGGGQTEGTAEAIALDGALCLRAGDGTVVEIRAGDVVHLR